MYARFNVVRCHGDIVETVDYPLDAVSADRSGDDLAYDLLDCVLDALCINNYVCESCYDHAYRLRFIGFTDGGGQPAFKIEPN